MKRFLLSLFAMLAISLSSFASTYIFKTTCFAVASINQVTGQYVWSDWEKSNLRILINTDTDVIVIYSNKTQYYKIYNAYNNGNSFRDSNGGETIKYSVYDAEGKYGEVRLRTDPNGNKQIYVDFRDYAWVYGVVFMQ